MARFITWISALLLAGAVMAGDVSRVLVVYNESEPEGKSLAQYYAQRRSIPADRLCSIRVRNAETITRKEFNENIREPIRQFMIERGLLMQLPGANGLPETFDIQISTLALIYGVPLRIDGEPGFHDVNAPTNAPAAAHRDEASVDSELTWLPSEGVPLGFSVPNPFFNKSPPVFDATLNNRMVLVARLDGPDPATVRRMIDDAIQTERVGLLGRCYIDAQNKQDAAYADGDRWLKDAGRALREAGFETEIENTGALFGDKFQMKDAAVYAGWYAHNATGAVIRADFKFRPGAIAYHLHSTGAKTLRSTQAHWAGPLLAKGAAATFGSVYEPYLALTPHVDLFFQRLLAGATFAEAGWYSQPGLSWQTTFVGDPLYRPFAVSVDGQIARLEAEKSPDVGWAYLRKINLLLVMGNPDAAQQLCAEKAAALNNWILMEKLGAMQLARPEKN